MRETCKGCVHYRSLDGSKNGEKCCHYSLDMPSPRAENPEECRKNGRYAAKNSKEAKRRIYLARKLTKFEFGKAVYGDTTYRERSLEEWILR
jgi:hypothetical protein